MKYNDDTWCMRDTVNLVMVLSVLCALLYLIHPSGKADVVISPSTFHHLKDQFGNCFAIVESDINGVIVRGVVAVPKC